MNYPDVRGVLPEDLMGVLVDVQPFQISVKSQIRLHVARKVAKYYEMIHRDLAPANMIWIVLKIFEEHWGALVENKDSDDPIVPKLAKGVSVPKMVGILLPIFEDGRRQVCNSTLLCGTRPVSGI